MDDRDSKTECKWLGFCHDMAEGILEILKRMANLLFQLRLRSPWMTIEEAERYAHVRRGVIMNAIRNGELAAYQRDGVRGKLVHRDDVDRWIRDHWSCTQVRVPEGVEA